MVLDIIYLIGGLILLFTGGNYLVKSSVSLAKHFKVSDFLIAVVIVSFGTSFPELIVSVKAALSQHPDISMGNVVGSNIANIALGIGIASLIFPVVVKKKNIYLDWLVMFVATITLIMLTIDRTLGRIDGAIFLLLFILYIRMSIRNDKKNNEDLDELKIQKPEYGKILSFVLVGLSIFALWLGAEGIIEGGSNVAKALGISERIISLTIIAFGTSLPEIATSVIAFYKKKPEITLGNIIGSNIFNILLILGITASIHPVAINEKILHFDYYWMVGTVLLIFPFINIVSNKPVMRIFAIFILITYIVYVRLLFF